MIKCLCTRASKLLLSIGLLSADLSASCCKTRNEIPSESENLFEQLENRGIDISCSYYIEFAGNPIGGISRGVGNAGRLDFRQNLI